MDAKNDVLENRMYLRLQNTRLFLVSGRFFCLEEPSWLPNSSLRCGVYVDMLKNLQMSEEHVQRIETQPGSKSVHTMMQPCNA